MNWQSVIEFLLVNWRIIVDCAALLLSVVICLIRKRPCINQMDSIKEYILEVLPMLIDSVEVKGQGVAKKYKVVELACSLVSKKYKVSVPDDLQLFISDAIENILSTPQKKGE